MQLFIVCCTEDRADKEGVIYQITRSREKEGFTR